MNWLLCDPALGNDLLGLMLGAMGALCVWVSVFRFVKGEWPA